MLPSIILMYRYQEANWYKPAPGEPYRPLIAYPSQLKDKLIQISPRFSSCTADFFTAYDPPHALMPAAELVPVAVPTPTTGGVGHPNSAPVPSPTQDARFTGKSAGSGGPKLLPPIVPVVDQPKATMAPGPIQDDGGPDPGHGFIEPASHNASPIPSQNSPGNIDTNHNKEGDPVRGSSPDQDNDPRQSVESNLNSNQDSYPSKKDLLPQTVLALEPETNHPAAHEKTPTQPQSGPENLDTSSNSGKNADQISDPKQGADISEIPGEEGDLSKSSKASWSSIIARLLTRW